LTKAIIKKIRDNNQRVLSSVITQIIDNRNIDNEFFHSIYPFTQAAIRIGITGPPGAGKSTIINKFIHIAIKKDKSVGVVAVDPTSPFTGGALLGDRVRMNNFSSNSNIFIRSLGSRGDLGGLAKRIQDVGDVLAASGKDIVIYETVGVGQGEYDVAQAVDITIVVLVPESGDEIQLMKAGLIEIADIFVINKSDRPDANRLAKTLKLVLESSTKPIEPAVINTTANDGEGITKLYEKIFSRLGKMSEKGIIKKKRLDRHRNRVFDLIQNRLLKEFWTSKRLVELEQRTNNLESTKSSAYQIAEEIMENAK